jgi:ketosteroid isomerase-like protein
MTSLDQELKDLDRGWVAAYLQGDAELFNRIWPERFVFTFPFGQFTSRKQEISNIGSGRLTCESISTDSLAVRTYGNTVVMTGQFVMKGRSEGRDITGRYSYANVIARQQDERWQIVASQSNRLG